MHHAPSAGGAGRPGHGAASMTMGAGTSARGRGCLYARRCHEGGVPEVLNGCARALGEVFLPAYDPGLCIRLSEKSGLSLKTIFRSRRPSQLRTVSS